MKVDTILDNRLNGKKLTRAEVIHLLSQKMPETQAAIYSAARVMRERYFGKNIFAYGFVYFSTYCRNDCTFCFYRKSNTEPPRYRKTLEEITALAKALSDSGVHMIDLTMGEDTAFIKDNGALLEVIQNVKKTTGLPVMVSPGVVSQNMIDAFQKAGVAWYALYQETYNRELYKKLRLCQDYDERMRIKHYARSRGLLIEEGLLTGVGDTLEDRADAMLAMGTLGVSQVRTMTFVPQKGTPLENTQPNSNVNELLNIAVMRLLYPDKLIPASLDVEGVIGLQERLMAGANVITSLIPPQMGLAGVSQSELDINDGSRTIAGVMPVLEACDLELATQEAYHAYIAKERKQL